MAIIQGNAHKSSVTGFYPKTINGSLRFNDDDSAYLSLEPTGTSGGRTKFTYSGWVKICEFSTSNGFYLIHAPCPTANNLNGSSLYINSSNVFRAQIRTYNTGAQGAVDASYTSSMVFRDPSAWYHIVFAFDSTATLNSDDTMRLWVNGVLQTNASPDYPSASGTQYLGSEVTHEIGRWLGSSHGNTNGYMAEVFFIDGTVYEASDFGETKNGVWVPKNITASDFTMGSNGFYLNFLDDTAVEAFNTVLYRGDGNDTKSVSGTGLTPDLVWLKNRLTTSTSHRVFDSVRGAQLDLRSDTTAAESVATNGFVSSFDSDGFTLQRGSSNNNGNNTSGDSYVAWCWDAGANNAVTGHSSVTYTGTGATQTISGLPFSPDLLWIAERNGSNGNQIVDTIRGAGANLKSHTNDPEGSLTTGVQSFLPNGFSIGTNTAYNEVNLNYVAWAWDAGDSDPVSNTTGSITSTVKASTTNGFSIISYTGTGANATVGHGLSSAPTFLMCKSRGLNEWNVYHSGLTTPSTYFMKLNNDEAENPNGAVRWNSTEPSSTEIYLGTAVDVNKLNDSHIIYAWHDVTGKQKFDTYEGNNTATGPTVNLGFRPGFVMIKNADGTGNWNIFDGSRFPFANNDLFLRANLSAAEVDGSGEGADAYEVEFTSTGFIPKASGASSRSQVNGSGTYIYAAFAGSYSDYITDYDDTTGSIPSRQKASNTTGFSVVSYVGTSSAGTVKHGLSSTPDMIIWKNRTSGTTGWPVYHSGMSGVNYFMTLNDGTVGESTDDMITAIGSSTFTLGTDNWNNQSGNDIIAYCWTATSGKSAFGVDTTSRVSCGFKPAFIMLRNRAAGGSWYLFDNTRDTDGKFNHQLYAQLSNSEDAAATDTLTIDDGTAYGNDGGGFTVTWTAQTDRYGSGVIYAAFADTREAAFWLDQSGNDNDWQPVNLDHNDTVADSPTDNFATWNPLDHLGSDNTFSDGNLQITVAAQNAPDDITRATMGISSGKFYWENTIVSTTAGDGGYVKLGLRSDDGNSFWNVRGSDGEKNDNGTTSSSSVAYDVGDVVRIAVDMDAGKWWVGVNANWVGDPSAGTGELHSTLTGLVLPCIENASSAGTHVVRSNFGQQPFKYSPPA